MLKIENENIHQLFYLEELTKNCFKGEITEEETRHIIKSLRKKVGDILFLTNGNGYIFKTQIDKIQKKSLIIKIIDHAFVAKPIPEIWLAAGLIRSQLFDFVIEKAAELGVDKIIPFKSQFVERDINKSERWKKIAVTAIKQSLQFHLPGILSPIPFNKLKNYFQEIPAENRLLAKDSISKKNITSLKFIPDSPIILIVGPEGGFSKEEFDFFSENSFQNISLGNTRLRAETAAIAGMAQLQFVLCQMSDVRR